MKFCIGVEVLEIITMQILVIIGSWCFGIAGVKFPTFTVVCVVVLETLWHHHTNM